MTGSEVAVTVVHLHRGGVRRGSAVQRRCCSSVLRVCRISSWDLESGDVGVRTGRRTPAMASMARVVVERRRAVRVKLSGDCGGGNGRQASSWNAV